MSIKIEHTTAGGINFEPNKKVGYYLLDNNIYYHKFQALFAASKQSGTVWNLNNDRVKWMFNEDVFVKFPWHIEPPEDLRVLYKQRAQQIRDQYDYVRLEFSGGSDSATVLYSFLLNGIHLDEIVFRYPTQGEKDAISNPWDTSSFNTLGEWEYAAKPILKWVATNFPAVKITVHDYAENMIDGVDSQDESWIYRTRHYLQPSHAHKHSHTALVDHKRTADQGVRIAALYGTDKPRICVKDGKFFIYFIDSIICNDSNIGEYNNITNELFFWTPDFPQLIAKQAHLVKQWFEQPVNHRFQNALQWPNNNFSNRTMYEQVVRNIVYPDYDPATFQTVKPTNNIYNEMDFWFHTNFKDTKMYNVWQAGVQHVLSNLNGQYVNNYEGRVANIHQYLSPLYCFGDYNIPPLTVGFETKQLMKELRDDQTTYRHVINGKLVIY